MNDTTASDCTCPSGDGSLHHPCPTHSIQRAQAQPAAAQEAVAWSKTKPTVEGAYYVRGFNLFQPAQYEALVQVRTHHFDGEPAPELVCNIHESTSNEDMDDWSPMVEMSDDFEWLGPLHAAPAAAAPVDLHAHLLHMLGAKDHEDAGRIIGELHAASMSTPAAPGIDLRKLTDSWLEQAERVSAKSPDKAAGLWACAKELRDALIDASPKGGHCTTCACDPSMTPAVRFDLSPAAAEGEIRNHLIALGWTPPGSPKGDDVQDDRFPRGLIDAIEYADNMEEAAEGLCKHVFGHESDGEDCGTVILQRVLGYLKDNPKDGSDWEATDADIAAWVARNDLGGSFGSKTDARVAFEDARSAEKAASAEVGS